MPGLIPLSAESSAAVDVDNAENINQMVPKEGDCVFSMIPEAMHRQPAV